MDYDDVSQAVHEARQRIKIGDRLLRDTADLLRGRLRLAEVDAYTLKELKRELRDFNIHTGTWKPR